MMRARIALAAFPWILLLGCSSQPSLPEARCRAAGGAAQLGQPLTDRSADAARMGAGALRTQVLRYGAPAPGTDVDPQRLNIEVDDKGVIQRLRCG
ncbi:hypothetical protein GCM10027034_12930 [Ramlibacter solisilvae]|uniref:Peptidase inhibitor I78 family protein n=1 Tax=Ramlibacter tataouinensis TaxID=94132 RepID=A0A127JX07_9BURK|nr:I78 family peptidase inhibitor [Ramlibacter tataouinensis]AMO24441.1 hypothetical protein UC35_18365 [Ramlibacter tataouinensis]